VLAQAEDNFKGWWSDSRKRCPKKDMRNFDTLVMLISWSLWKQPNARFSSNLDMQRSTGGLVTQILEEWSLCKLAKTGMVVLEWVL
jgi:hypothetical protein